MNDQYETQPMTSEEKAAFNKKRRGRNIAIALTVAGLCVLFYVVSIIRMGSGG